MTESRDPSGSLSRRGSCHGQSLGRGSSGIGDGKGSGDTCSLQDLSLGPR